MSKAHDHVSDDTLAELVEDGLPGNQAADARAHLATCSQCQSTYELLVGMPALLASFAPAQIPLDVNARVIAALERESQARATEPRPTGEFLARPVSARARGWRGLLGPRLALGALGVAAVLGVGYIVFQQPGSGSTESAADLGQPPASAPLTAEAGPDGDGLSGRRSGFDYRPNTLDEGVRALVAIQSSASGRFPGESVDPESPPKTMSASSQSPTSRDSPTAVGTASNTCVRVAQKRAGSFASVLALDEAATYNDDPAVVVVLALEPDDGAQEVDVWVLNRACREMPIGEDDLDAGVVVLAHTTVKL